MKNTYYLFLLFVSLGWWSCQTVSADKGEKKEEVVLAFAMDSVEAVPEPVVIPFDSTISDAYLMGQFDPAQDKRFVRIAPQYAKRGGMLMREEAYAAFVKMAAAAEQEGVQLYILSATRNFKRQKAIWEAKWTGARKVDGQDLSKTIPATKQRAQKILQWSSMPGSSRHHWGTDIDINALENRYFAQGKGLVEYNWLVKNAAQYGFCQPYSPKGEERPEGYNEEKWHWSFLPLAVPLTQQVKLRLTNDKIKGFSGAAAAAEVDIVENYVLGINHACK